MSSVHLLSNACSLCHIVVQRVNEPFCTVVSIFGGTGAPFTNSAPNLTYYPSVDAAIADVKKTFHSHVVLHAEHLIGIIQNGAAHILGFVTKSRECAKLPNGHVVKVVEEAKFASVSIDGVNLDDATFAKFPVTENHYFCETYDISRPYPSSEPVSNPDTEFCWNLKWRSIFCDAGLPEFCMSLLQGLYTTFEHQGFAISYVIRRSSLNPGVRWLGRGFNDKGGPGNEVESELVFWNTSSGEFWTHFWRRGTVPLKWKTECSSIVSTKEVQVVESNFCEATKNYFNRLHEKYGGASIHCVCLLKQNKGTEDDLFKAYGEAIEIMRTKHGMDWVWYDPFDVYHFFKKDDKEKNTTVKMLMWLLSKIDSGSGLNHGDEKQKAIVRINCADSLDRTNMVSFFQALLVTAEWCRRAKLVIVEAPPFSPDHLEQSIPTDIVHFLVRAFVKGGNIISLLYTNTEAQRAEMIWKFAGQADPGSSALKISLQRRWNNVMTDPGRHENILLWTKDKHRFIDRFAIDHRSLVVVTPEFPAFLYELHGIPDPHECEWPHLKVILPAGVALTAIWLYQFPTKETDRLLKVTVNDTKVVEVPNVNKPTWARYRVNLGLERCVNLTFSPTPFIIGKIAFEGTRSAFEVPTNRSAETDVYKEMLLAAVESKERTFQMLSELERTRISDGIPIDVAHSICASLNVNPWVVSPARYLLRETCCFCGSEVPPPRDPDLWEGPDAKYYISWCFPSLLTNEKPEKDPTRVTVCEKCQALADAEAAHTKTLEELVIRASIVPQMFPRGTTECSEAVNISASPYGCFSRCPKGTSGDVNSLLTEAGGAVQCDPHAKKFTLALLCYAQIERIEVECEGHYKFKLRGDAKQVLKPETTDGNREIFKVQLTTNVVRFMIKSNTSVVLRRVAVFGRPCEYGDIHIGPRLNFQPYVLEHNMEQRAYQWDEETRTQSFQKSVEARFTVRVIIWVQEPRTAASNLIFRFENRSQLVSQLPVRIPVISQKGKIVYKFDIPSDITHVKVLYCDIRRECAPLPMRISKTARDLRHNAKSAAAVMAVLGPGAKGDNTALSKAAGLVSQLDIQLHFDPK